MSNFFFWVIAIIMVGLGIFTNYTNWKMYFSARKAKEMFLKNHPDSHTVTINKYRSWLFAALAIACFIFGYVLMSMENESVTGDVKWSQALVYAGLGIFAIAMIAEARTTSLIVYCPDGFMYEDTYIKYRSINNVVVGKGFFKPSLLQLTGAKEIALPKTIAAWVEQQWLEYRQNRKDKRTRNKGRKGRKNTTEAE